MIDELRKDLKKLATPAKAKASAWFFKTGKGEYGEGDIFIGVTVPEQRKVSIKYKDMPLSEIRELLNSKIHEERLTSLFILVLQFKKGSPEIKKEIFDFYLSHTKFVNNWDLVDSSAPYIVGMSLIEQGDISLLRKLASSENIWERRIAMVSSHVFARFKKSAKETFEIAEILIPDKHDLIQKAVGWMLREAGKNCGQEAEEEFLVRHYKQMGRTALRYAIEHFSPKRRKEYLAGIV